MVRPEGGISACATALIVSSWLSLCSPCGGAQRRNPGLESRIAPRFRGGPCGLLGGLRVCRAVTARGFGESARGAVDDLDVVLPRQAIAPGDEVAHVGVGAIPRAARDRGEAAVAELINVVLDAPMGARLAPQIRAHLGGDDLVGAARSAVGEDGAVEIDDHPL